MSGPKGRPRMNHKQQYLVLQESAQVGTGDVLTMADNNICCIPDKHSSLTINDNTVEIICFNILYILKLLFFIYFNKGISL